MSSEASRSIAAFEAAFKSQPRADGWLANARSSGMARFRELGVPTTRGEEWRYTKVRPLQRTEFVRASEDPKVKEAEKLLAPFEALAHRIVLIDGHYSAALSASSWPEGVTVEPLAEALKREGDAIRPMLESASEGADDGFEALNVAFAGDGAFVRLKGQVDSPIAIVHLSTAPGENAASHPMSLVMADTGSEGLLVEIHAGVDGRVYLSNAVTRLTLAKNAALRHLRLFADGDASFSLAKLRADQGEGSRLVSIQVALGGAVVRNDARVELEGRGAEADLKGLYLATRGEHIDNFTTIHHVAPGCTSHELYKGIVDADGVGSFTGRVIVDEQASGTVAHQQNRNLLLSSDGEANTRPQLEIYAKEVEASHGATVGQLEDNQLFYLRSRGLTEAEARSLLKLAFASELVDELEPQPLRDLVRQAVFDRLGVADSLRKMMEDDGGE